MVLTFLLSGTKGSPFEGAAHSTAHPWGYLCIQYTMERPTKQVGIYTHTPYMCEKTVKKRRRAVRVSSFSRIVQARAGQASSPFCSAIDWASSSW